METKTILLHKESAAFAKMFDSYRKQLDALIKNFSPQSNIIELITRMRDDFSLCLQSDHLSCAIDEYTKMIDYIDQYDLQYLHAHTASIFENPINNNNIQLIVKLELVIIQGSYQLLKKTYIDEKHICTSGFEHDMYKKLIDIRSYIIKTTISHLNKMTRARLLFAYYLLTQDPSIIADNQQTIEEILSMKDEMQIAINMIKDVPGILITSAYYELSKTSIAYSYIRNIYTLRHSSNSSNSSNLTPNNYYAEYTTLLINYKDDIIHDPAMSTSLGYQEALNIFSQLEKQPKKPKKKAKKKSSGLKDFEIYESWLMRCEEIFQQYTHLAQENDVPLILAIQKIIRLLPVDEFKEIYTQFSNLLINIPIKILDQITLNDTEQHTKIKLNLLEVIIEVGIYYISALNDKICIEKHKLKNSTELLHVFFKPSIFLSNNSQILFDDYTQCSYLLLSGIIIVIELYSGIHTSIITQDYLSKEDFINYKTIIHTHINESEKFHLQTQQEVVRNKSQKAHTYMLDKIRYINSCIKIKFADNPTELQEYMNAFKVKYIDLIDEDPYFANTTKYSNLPFNCEKLEATSAPGPAQSLSELNQLDLVQQEFTASLAETLNSNSFESLHKKQLKQIEKLLNAPFNLNTLHHKKNQYETFMIYSRNFSFYSLSKLFAQETPFINERSANILSGLVELLISTGYKILSQIEFDVGLLSHHKLGQENLIAAGEDTRYFFVDAIFKCVQYVCKIYLLLSQELLNSLENNASKYSTQKINVYLNKINGLLDKLHNTFNKGNYIIPDVLQYQTSILQENLTSIAYRFAKQQLNNNKEVVSLEKKIHAIAQERKANFPQALPADQLLTPSYGHEELNNFYNWIKLHDPSNQPIQENIIIEELKSTSNHKKKKKKSPTKTEQILPTESIEIKPIEIKPIKITPKEILEPEILKEELITSLIIEPEILEPQELEVLCEVIDHVPLFFIYNHNLKIIFDQFANTVSTYMCNYSTYLYGSGIFKQNPSDLDFCILNINTSQDMEKLNTFIEHLHILGAKTKPKDSVRNQYGYIDNGRHTIEINWAQIKMDITISKHKTFTDFATDLDYAVCAMAFDCAKQKMFHLLTTNGWEDILYRQLNTVNDSIQNFTADPSRILRGIKLIATENFSFSQDCKNAIYTLFSGNNNLFDAEHIRLNVLLRHLKKLLHSHQYNQQVGFFNYPNNFAKQYEINCMYNLYQLGLIPKLIGRLLEHSDDPVIQVYLKILIDYNNYFFMQQNQQLIYESNSSMKV